MSSVTAAHVKLALRSLNPLTPFRSSHCRKLQSTMSSVPQRIFQLRLDPLTGSSEWVVLDDDPQEPPKALLSSTSYLDMLNDSRRNRAFNAAIKKTVTRPCHVLDIGAGTGLLSMMAARVLAASDGRDCNAGEGIVSACESYLPMGKLMRKVLRSNGMESKIHVIHKRSDELKVGVDLPSHADILISEILDSELLGEGVIPTLQHAHDMLLAENPQMVPYRATTYGQLVQSEFLWKLHDLYSSEAHASDGVYLVPPGSETAICVKPHQYPMYCSALSEEIRLLSEPFKIFEFDFWKRPKSCGEIEQKIEAKSNGRVHAIISWWVLQLDYEGSVFYSTAPKWITSPFRTQEVSGSFPGVGDWCDHWKQCVWFIPGMGLSISKDDEVLLQAVHDSTSISYDLRKNDKLRTELKQCDFRIGENQLLLLPDRIAIYGDREWRLAMQTATRNALQGKVAPLCVIADDSIFVTILMACLSTRSHVISMLPGLHQTAAPYLRVIADANGFSVDRVKVLGRRAEFLTLDDTSQRKVGLLAGEPFYSGNEGMLPWQNLRFWKERTLLDPILSDDVSIIPCKGILKGCAMSLPDLWRSRCSLKEIEGFDHSAVNETLGACGDLPEPHEGPCLSYFIWQCGEIKELSEVFSVMDFNFSEKISTCSGKTKVAFTKSGICHGFALWIDWVMDARNSIVVSTGPAQKYWRQGVKLLRKPVPVNTHGSCNLGESFSAEIEGSFDPSSGEIVIKSSFLSPDKLVL